MGSETDVRSEKHTTISSANCKLGSYQEIHRGAYTRHFFNIKGGKIHIHGNITIRYFVFNLREHEMENGTLYKGNISEAQDHLPLSCEYLEVVVLVM
ncbi:hypothetical protein BofuT4_P146490.1 [Botrytis cinerea T4]|uniref:Uncharacterized protein n=1 Tax=Botryotinia fuckeliana (strain T4) TaxID=999810 RepID=G2YXY2_BOTF4|nr:hypothetical protein BofuT4_P146490.1 [Botrytis cinerea T4]